MLLDIFAAARERAADGAPAGADGAADADATDADAFDDDAALRRRDERGAVEIDSFREL